MVQTHLNVDVHFINFYVNIVFEKIYFLLFYVHYSSFYYWTFC